MSCHELFILDLVFQIAEKKQQNKSKKILDVIIDDPYLTDEMDSANTACTFNLVKNDQSNSKN